MKHFRILFPILALALLLSGCAAARQPYDAAIDSKRTVTIDPAAGTIRYSSDIYRYKIKDTWDGTQYKITYPDGRRYTYTESAKDGTAAWSEGNNPSIYIPGELLIRALKQSAPEAPEVTREKKGNPVAGIFCILGGVLLMVFHKRTSSPDSPRRFLRMGRRSHYAVEISPEEYAAFIFIDGVVLLLFGLYQCFF